MARLFIGPREQQFVSDITKEFVKDVVGQFIYYYPVSMINTTVHPVYDEAVEKVFENPIKMDVLAGQPERASNWNSFGLEGDSQIEILVQARDLLDKGVDVYGGDFFVYGSEVYEVIGTVAVENIYGQAEYEKARKITGHQSRSGQFDLEDFKKLLKDSQQFDESNVQKKFVQQRGLAENEEGATADTRQVRDRLGDEMAEVALGEGPRKVDVDREDSNDVPLDIAKPRKGSGFYNE